MTFLKCAVVLALHIETVQGILFRSSPDYATKECNSVFKPLSGGNGKPQKLSLAEYPPHMRGGEKHSDLREELKTMAPSLGKEILQLAAPQPAESHLLAETASYSGNASLMHKKGAKCSVARFVQYAYCTELISAWAPKNKKWTAFSFGGKGYDDWSQGIKQSFAGVVPEVFDCFDTRPIEGLGFHPQCIGGKLQRDRELTNGGLHDFQDLNVLLKNKDDRSVLMKIDIEGSEFDVLQELEAASMRKIASLTVEYHFFGGNRCCEMDKMKQLFEKLHREFIIVDGSAQRWGTDKKSCVIEGGFQWPQALSVSYVARDLLEK